MSFGSQTSLSQRELSQEDTTSSGSRRSSIELPDDKDRLATIDSAIKWIKNELVSQYILSLLFLQPKVV